MTKTYNYSEALEKLAAELDYVSINKNNIIGGILFDENVTSDETNPSVCACMGDNKLKPIWYRECEEDYEKFKNVIIDIYTNTNMYDKPNISKEVINRIFSEEYVRNNIFFCLVNTQKNQMMLENVPHRDFLDLSIVYRIDTSEQIGESSSMLINNTMAEQCSYSEETLYDMAYQNTIKKMDFEIISLDKMFSTLGVEGFEELEELPAEARLWALCNKKSSYGASMILYADVLKSFCDDKGIDTVFILPSSTEEVLLKPCMENHYENFFDLLSECNALESIVTEVNKTLDEHIILSDSLYIYNRNTGIAFAKDFVNDSVVRKHANEKI